jgi:hypothetical protein
MVLIQGASSLSPPAAGHYHTITQARITPTVAQSTVPVTAASDETLRLRVCKSRAKSLSDLGAFEQRVPADSSTSERPLYEGTRN